MNLYVTHLLKWKVKWKDTNVHLPVMMILLSCYEYFAVTFILFQQFFLWGEGLTGLHFSFFIQHTRERIVLPALPKETFISNCLLFPPRPPPLISRGHAMQHNLENESQEWSPKYTSNPRGRKSEAHYLDYKTHNVGEHGLLCLLLIIRCLLRGLPAR